MNAEAPVWLFDSACMLCSRAVHYVLKHERKPDIRFVAIKSDEGRAIAARHGVDPENPQTFLFIEKGVALAKSDGVLALLRHVGGPARIFSLGVILPQRLRDFAYDLIAQNRHRLFGKTSFCRTPEGAELRRFVLPES
ncbi:MAG: thiol-disulfide oxidoreductase DCC family protein [Aestuariivirga sp.]